MHYHFKLNKPFGYISQFQGELKKKFLGELYNFPEGTMAIGRLDEQSEGLLLLTTNGVTSERIRSKSIEKEYHVQIDGIISEKEIKELENGVWIGIRNVKYKTLPCSVKALNPPPDYPLRIKKIRDDRHGPTSWLSITLKEGKYRQIRKMTAAVGLPTLRLIRVRVGNIKLDNLGDGQVVPINDPGLLID